MAKSSTSRTNQTNGKAQQRQAEEAMKSFQNPIDALHDIGQSMRDCPFSGWTIQACILALVDRANQIATLLPIPTEPKAAKDVKALLHESMTALAVIKEGANLFDGEFDWGLNCESGGAALGAVIESLSKKSLTAFEAAAVLMGADKVMCAFYEPPAEARHG